MSLLFDQNISYKVTREIADIFPGSKHLSDLRIENYTDIEIWHYAKSNNYCIVTFDHDFIDLSVLKGFPPKILLLKTGNISNAELVGKLRYHRISIDELLNHSESAFLEIK